MQYIFDKSFNSLLETKKLEKKIVNNIILLKLVQILFYIFLVLILTCNKKFRTWETEIRAQDLRISIFRLCTRHKIWTQS